MKRVVSLQDLSCIGKCSQTVALPVLSIMGVECVALPTALLSAHTAFPDFFVRDLTDCIAPIAAHWKSLGLRFAQLRFTTESASECVRVLRAYQGEAVEAPENITRGLFYRGAE